MLLLQLMSTPITSIIIVVEVYNCAVQYSALEPFCGVDFITIQKNCYNN